MQRIIGSLVFTKINSPHHKEWYDLVSEQVEIPLLGGKAVSIDLNCSIEEIDEHEDEIAATLANFLSMAPERINDLKAHLFAFYQDFFLDVGDDLLDEMPYQENDENILDFISLSRVTLSHSEQTKRCYMVVSGGCDWEIEHGLSVSFENGNRLVWVGEASGDLYHTDAKGNVDTENLIYRGHFLSTKMA